MDHLSLGDDLQRIVCEHNVVLLEFVRVGKWCVYWFDTEADKWSRHGFAEAQTLRRARAIAKRHGPPGHALIIVEPGR